MRLKRNRLKTYHHRQAVLDKDLEGSSYVRYTAAVPFQAETWPGSGKMQTEMYGIRLPNIRNLRIHGKYNEIRAEDGKTVFRIEDGPEITIGDGICLFKGGDDDPDYKVIAVYPRRFLTLEVERQ